MSVAARFWGVPPWELEERGDALYWIHEAAMISNAEVQARAIKTEHDKIRNGKTGK